MTIANPLPDSIERRRLYIGFGGEVSKSVYLWTGGMEDVSDLHTDESFCVLPEHLPLDF
jgi:hypothetical protein